MADELPLKVRIQSADEGELKTIEYLVGEEEDSIEPVGKLFTVNDKNIIYYRPYATKHMKSFHLRNNALEQFCIELMPDKEVILMTGDQIGWGATEPEVVTEIGYRLRNPKYIN